MKNRKILDLFWIFFKIGAFTFGGGYAMIAMIERYCVEEKGWITSDELLNVMVIAESTPGPIAINCSTFTGYKVGGIWGALVATVANVLPSVVLIYFISLFFENLLKYAVISNIFAGISVAVCFLIVKAGLGMAKKILGKSKKKTTPIILISAFCAIAVLLGILGINFSNIYLMTVGGFCGFWIYRNSPQKLAKKLDENSSSQQNGSEGGDK